MSAAQLLLRRLLDQAGGASEAGYVLVIDSEGLENLPNQMPTPKGVYAVHRVSTELGLRHLLWRAKGAPLIAVMPEDVARRIQKAPDLLRRARNQRIHALSVNDVLEVVLGVRVVGADAPYMQQLALEHVDKLGIALSQLTLPTVVDRKLLTELLSRDSPVDQRIDISLAVQGFDGRVDFAIKRFGIGECLMGQMIRLEIAPDSLDVIELRGVFWQPLDGEPVLARIERRQGDFADMDRPIILDQHDGSCHAPRLGAKEAIELLQMGNEIGAALGPARMHDEPASYMIERTHHGHLLGLPRRRHTQVGTAFGPCPRQIGMRQRLALVAVKQHDVASLGLGLAQLKPEPNALDLVRDLPPLQRVPWPPPPEVFFRSALESCDGPISTSSRFLISSMRRGIVQFVRFATGASSNGTQTRSAASVFSGGGPAYTLA